MEHMPLKRERTPTDDRTPSERARDEWIANRQKASTPPAKPKEVVRKNRTAPKETWEQRLSAADQQVNRAQKATAKKQAPTAGGTYKESQHPRDRFGRFAVKVAKGAVNVTKKTIKGTAKAVKSAHRTVKRINADMRHRDALAHRERKLDLHKREVAAGLKRPRTIRRKKQVRKRR